MRRSRWIIEIVRVSSRAKQREVLSHFPGLNGLTATGLSAGPDHLVVLACASDLLKSLADLVISDIDDGADCDYTSEASRSDVVPWLAPKAAASSPN
jgi:hypothetical protein